jgi:predicted dehydrogenase
LPANVTSRLFSSGVPWRGGSDQVEDYASARLDLDTGATVQLACSWKLPAGQDAVIKAAFYGTRGGVTLSNVNGSFYEFVTERCQGTSRTVLTSGPDDWGGRAAAAWASRLGQCPAFDPDVTCLIDVARALDDIYAQHRT